MLRKLESSSLARDLLTLDCLFAGVDSVVRTQLRDASGSHHTFLVCWIWQAQSDTCLTVAMPVHNSTTGVLSYLHLPIPSFSTLLYEKAFFQKQLHTEHRGQVGRKSPRNREALCSYIRQDIGYLSYGLGNWGTVVRFPACNKFSSSPKYPDCL